MHDTPRFAHSLEGRPSEAWEGLSRHLQAVAEGAASYATVFGCSELARAAGLLHDIGKMSLAFQEYIRTAAVEGAQRRGPDHSTAGAVEAIRAYGHFSGRLLAKIIAGHHAGLPDPDTLDRRLGPDWRIEPYDGWVDHTGPLPPRAALRPSRRLQNSPAAGFTEAFLTRMLFSCLVDADFLATEAFYSAAEERQVPRGNHAPIVALRDRLRHHMASLRSDGAEAIQTLRQAVLAHAVGKACLQTGLFTLTVPTGGGKTLASLSFALEHAVRHGLRRIIYVIPFTSIIEQTASVFREALGTEDDVLEHHASFDWGDPDDDDEGTDGRRKLRRAAENWDVPVVVTTAVQFFESLFANRTSLCRKLHNLADAVIVLDEAQMLPLHVLRPCMAALDELARNYGTSVVLCTATQPALRVQDEFANGFDIGAERELAPTPRALYAALKRVRVEVRRGPTDDATIAARFAEQQQMLCIVNSRAHARAIFDAIRELPGAVHLSTLMCPVHRRRVLEDARQRIASGASVRIASTSLIEAGVDISLPEVWRAAAGLDSLAQAVGRCNRHGLLAEGRVVVFEPETFRPPHAIETFWQAARPVLRGQEDVLGFDAVHAYFRELYFQKGEAALDATMVRDARGVMRAIAAGAPDGRFPFRSIAEAFRLIADAMETVIVPIDETATGLLRRIAAAERPPTLLLRRLQGYTVSIPKAARLEWLRRGALRPVHPALGEGLLCFGDAAHYRPETGLDLDAIGMRAAAANVW